MTTREEIRKLAENAAAYPDPNHPGGKIWDARIIGLIESAILAGIRLVLEREPSTEVCLASGVPVAAARAIWKDMTAQLLKGIEEEK